jgi:cytochrome c-type biogenesis protein CcmH/NrfF
MRPVVLALVLLASVPALAEVATQRDVEESLTCQCGCGLTVHSCNHIQCGSGEPIKKEIAERLARGETKDQILAAFTKKFGEKVLSSPTMQGFNRLAWIMPFAALFVAGTVLTVVIRKRARATAAALDPAPAAGRPPASDALRERLARELADLDRES